MMASDMRNMDKMRETEFSGKIGLEWPTPNFWERMQRRRKRRRLILILIFYLPNDEYLIMLSQFYINY